MRKKEQFNILEGFESSSTFLLLLSSPAHAVQAMAWPVVLQLIDKIEKQFWMQTFAQSPYHVKNSMLIIRVAVVELRHQTRTE